MKQTLKVLKAYFTWVQFVTLVLFQSTVYLSIFLYIGYIGLLLLLVV